ncbi:PLP-dependent aminotransferase family protein [Pedobacter sp. SYSU D00535]|uniref:MocR-like pyridoxine biosynthesis transcription factor PdxR n=1 Tax=Pedobacter sp. SYSU D00535 TaxID=2810308 RepID=UPI001A974F7E|nr:PLP-dependent aminotransferase family protein [Pedobacter sp. SYSU D00535]
MLRPWKTFIHLNFECVTPLHTQIANGIIEEIRKGRLKPATALPGTRILAQELGVSRKVIVMAFEDLTIRGWLETVAKKGTFVSSGKSIPETDPVPAANKYTYTLNTPPSSLRLLPHAETSTIVFNDGLPDVRLAPIQELGNAYRRIIQRKGRWRMLGYGHERGDESLRLALCNMLTHDRALSLNELQICVTRGSQMALYLTAKVLLKAGDCVAVEDPGYSPFWDILKACGARILPVAVDGQGMQVDKLEDLCKQLPIKAVYTTPHHQFPTTVAMSKERREALVSLSNRFGFAIIEDDYDHEYHYAANRNLPLKSYSNSHNVIYIGSVSKLIAPSLRVGYVVGPEDFIEAVAAYRLMVDRQGDVTLEQALAELMQDGEVSRHAREALAIYHERFLLMEQLLHKHLKVKCDFHAPQGGLAYWLRFKEEKSTLHLQQELLRRGVSVIPSENFSFERMSLNALRLGYASLNAAELEEGIKKIAEVI